MSNKALITLVVVILVLFAGGVIYSKMQSTRNENLSDNYSNEQTTQTPITPSPSPSQSTTTPATTASSTPTTATGECKRVVDTTKFTMKNFNIKNRQVEVSIKDFGKIKLELYDQDAPKAVENFLRLTDSGYYNCLTIHRVSKNFVIQGGDPNGDGTGGQSAFGAAFVDELNPDTASYKAGYKKGVLAMANSGPNTNGSQFFIMLADVSLPHNYTIFGKVIEGQSVVDKIGQVEIIPNPFMGPTDGAPKVPVVMETVKIVK